jgi:hypothetical protein
VAVDGSKFKACAAKRSVVDAEKLQKQRERIEKQITDYLEELDEADRQDEGQVQPTVEQIEAALERLRKRDQKLEQAQTQLAAQAQAAAQGQTPRAGLTDPDAVLLRGAGGDAVVGYNVQQAVDTRHNLIVAHEVTTLRNDHTSLEPVATEAQTVLGAQSMIAVTDCGYMNGAQAQACEERGITPVVPMPRPSHTRAAECYPKSMFAYDSHSDSYRCPAGELLTRYKRDAKLQTDYYTSSACGDCPLRAKCTKSKRRSIARSWFADAAERAHRRADVQMMRLRRHSAEHPFGNVKAILNNAFSVRTLPKVRGEMALAVLAYNMKRAAKVLGIEEIIEKLWISAVLSGA